MGTAGFNLGLTQAKGNYIMFVAADMIFNKNCIAHLLTVFDDAKTIGLVAPIVYNNNKLLEVSGAWVSYDFYANATKHKINHPKKIPFIGIGIISKKALNKIGGYIYDPTYFVYGEDVDLGFRLTRAGYSIWIIPAAKMINSTHLFEFTLPENKRVFLCERNMLRNAIKYGGIKRFIFAIISRFIRAGYNVLQGKPGKAIARIKAVKAVLI
jgi:GT2 family glycosyltransferase